VTLTVIIADDEPLALDRLSDLLDEIPRVKLVAACQGGGEAIEAIDKHRPQLVFLDVDMPKIDGFDVVEAVARHAAGDHEPPLVCFVTAYPQFAANAFDCGALDFLCKPVRLGRLEEAIGRAERALAQREALARLEELAGRLEQLRETRAGPPADDSLWVQQRGQMIRIAYDALDWVEAEGEYVRLHGRDQSYLLRGSITALADRLADHGFIRIHRSAIVNTARIASIRSGRTGVSLVLDKGLRLPVGRTYRPAVRALRSGAAEMSQH
jgi:DNA-binding LytR/AlgR family response regulator